MAPLPVTQFKGERIKIGFDLGLFERALQSQQSPLVRWSYVSPNAGTVLIEEGEEWQSGAVTVVMPIRIKEENEDEKRDNRIRREAA